MPYSFGRRKLEKTLPSAHLDWFRTFSFIRSIAGCKNSHLRNSTCVQLVTELSSLEWSTRKMVIWSSRSQNNFAEHRKIIEEKWTSKPRKKTKKKRELWNCEVGHHQFHLFIDSDKAPSRWSDWYFPTKWLLTEDASWNQFDFPVSKNTIHVKKSHDNRWHFADHGSNIKSIQRPMIAVRVVTFGGKPSKERQKGTLRWFSKQVRIFLHTCSLHRHYVARIWTKFTLTSRGCTRTKSL